MLFLEPYARLVAVVHTVAAGVLLGSATHHLLTCRRYLRGRSPRVALERLYALVCASAFAVTFLLGASLYPTYKVRVRASFFDAPDAVAAEVQLREAQARTIGGPPPLRARGPAAARDLSWVSRLFDVKEHVVAIGLGAALVLLALSRLAHPSEDPRLAPLYVGLSLFVCIAAWLGAIVGIVTASYRSVGGLP